MAKKQPPQQENIIPFQITSILGGQSQMMYQMNPDQFLTSMGIDPDMPSDGPAGSKTKAGGMITPSTYSTFSSSAITNPPLWIITNPKNALMYFILRNGVIVSNDITFAAETTVGTAATSSGNGAAYYNNYLYVAQNGDIARYGPLDNSPSLTSGVWTAATLGSQTAIDNAQYPPQGSGFYPNHAMHAHIDNKLYFCDFGGTNAASAQKGIGMIHYIKTKRTTDQGDTNDASAYAALKLPFGFMPTDIESYGNDLAILAVQTNDGNIRQGNAAMFLWDTFSQNFYRQIPIPDPLATAILNVNGQLFVWSGMGSTRGHKLLRYLGGYAFEQSAFLEEGSTPMAGAVDVLGTRIVWPAEITYPSNNSCVFSYGYKALQQPAIHNIAATYGGTAASTLCLKYVSQSQAHTHPGLVIGWVNGSSYGLSKRNGGGGGNSVFRSQYFNIGQAFRVNKIKIPLSTAVASGHLITPKLWFDDESSSLALTTINNTNYPNSERKAIIYPPVAQGDHNFFLELTFAGTADISAMLPITGEIQLLRE